MIKCGSFLDGEYYCIQLIMVTVDGSCNNFSARLNGTIGLLIAGALIESSAF